MPIEWTNLYRRFKGLWIALGDDEKTVLASGKSAKEAMMKAQKKGHSLPIITRMPDRLDPYVGGETRSLIILGAIAQSHLNSFQCPAGFP